MSNEGEFPLAEFPGTAPKLKTSQICCPFDVLLHLTVDTFIDIIILISPWLINEDSLCCLLCLADSDTIRVAHVFLFSACNKTQRKKKTWYEVHYRWTCFAAIHTMPGEQSSSVSALGKCADNVEIVSYSQKWSKLKLREGVPKKQKRPRKITAKEVSLKSPHLVFWCSRNGNCGNGQTAS